MAMCFGECRNVHPFTTKKRILRGSFGCFQKLWYPQIIHLIKVFHYKPSILGYPYFWKHPFIGEVGVNHQIWDIFGRCGLG